MQADTTSRTLILLVVLALAAWAVWLVWDVLPPFLIALGLAWLLDPLLERMQRRGLPRWAAVTLTFAGFLAVFAAAVLFVVPRAAAQTGDLLGNLDGYIRQLTEAANTWAEKNADLLRRLNLPPTLPELWQRYQADIGRYLQAAVQHLFAVLEATAGKLGWVVIIPIVTLYLLADLDALQARLYHLLPHQHRELVAELSSKVGRVFVAYMRGLVMVSAAYGLVVYVALAAGFLLPYAVILGLLAGVLYAVPYVGQFSLLIVCCLVAWLSGRPLSHVLAISITLVVIGQVFDQFITPRVIGKQVGLHPVLGLFALMVGAQLFGLVGMILAVPVAAAARVVLMQLFPRLGEPIPEEELARLRPAMPAPESPSPEAAAPPAASTDPLPP
jgi:predicted PurR-regulated permease PerM